jgi:hypothetical protein
MGRTLASAPRCAAIAAVIALGACSALQVPTQQSIQGLTPSGTVTLTETFVAGAGAGSGTLIFNGQSYPFNLIGLVIGPGGADRITASGEVYKLSNVSDFPGRYTQGSGAAGLSHGGEGQFWLQVRERLHSYGSCHPKRLPPSTETRELLRSPEQRRRHHASLQHKYRRPVVDRQGRDRHPTGKLKRWTRTK